MHGIYPRPPYSAIWLLHLYACVLKSKNCENPSYHIFSSHFLLFSLSLSVRQIFFFFNPYSPLKVRENFSGLKLWFSGLWRSAVSLVVIDFSKDYTSTTFNLKTKAADFSEMFVITNNNTRCHNPEDLTNSMKQGPFWKPPVHQLLKYTPKFYRTTRFIATFKRANHFFYPDPD
jgi:hypothetical protein